MKKFIITMSIIFCVSIVAFGITVGTHWQQAVALAKNGGTMENYVEQNFIAEENKTFNKINLVLDADALDIVIGERLSLKTFTTQRHDISKEFDNDVFSVKITARSIIWFGINNGNRNRSILTVPQDFNGNIAIDNKNGEIIMNTANLNLQKLDLDTSNAKIEVSNVTLNTDSSFTTSNGAITINNIVAQENLLVKTNNNAISATNITSTKDITLKSSNGKISFDNITSNNLFANTSNSKIIGINLHSPNATLDTVNGDIDVTLQNDYFIEYSTSNGKTLCGNADLGKNGTHGNSASANKIFLKTSNSNIIIRNHC